MNIIKLFKIIKLKKYLIYNKLNVSTLISYKDILIFLFYKESCLN